MLNKQCGVAVRSAPVALQCDIGSGSGSGARQCETVQHTACVFTRSIKVRDGPSAAARVTCEVPTKWHADNEDVVRSWKYRACAVFDPVVLQHRVQGVTTGVGRYKVPFLISILSPTDAYDFLGRAG